MKSRRHQRIVYISIKLTFLASLVAVLLFNYGCEPDYEDIILCDGSDDVRLAYRMQSSVGRIPPGEQVMVENGYSFLYLDGQCRYWAFPREYDGSSDSIWSDVVTGKLTPGQEAKLKDDLSVIQWQAWDQKHFHEPGLFDAGTATFWTPMAMFQCSGDCGSNLREEIYTNTRTWIRTLAEQGDPVEGAVRVAAIIMPDEALPNPLQPVPEDIDLREHAVSFGDAYNICFGDGILVTGDVADTLRRYRREYYGGKYGNFDYRYLPLEAADGQKYMVYVRDTTPPEGDNGLVQLEGISTSICPD